MFEFFQYSEGWLFYSQLSNTTHYNGLMPTAKAVNIRLIPQCTRKIQTLLRWPVLFLPPANEVCEGYVFTGACLSIERGLCSKVSLSRGLSSGELSLLGGLCPRGVSGQEGDTHPTHPTGMHSF